MNGVRGAQPLDAETQRRRAESSRSNGGDEVEGSPRQDAHLQRER